MSIHRNAVRPDGAAQASEGRPVPHGSGAEIQSFKQRVGRVCGAGLLAAAIVVMALASPTPAIAAQGLLIAGQ